MGRQIHPLVAMLALLLVVLGVAMIYSRRLQQPAPIAVTGEASRAIAARGRGPGGPRMGPQGTPLEPGGTRASAPVGPGRDADLGLTWEASRSPRGMKVTDFSSIPGPSPLELMGVKPGDVIVSCNGDRERIRTKVGEALDALRENGTPFTIAVDRSGRQLTLRATRETLSPAK